MDIIIEGILINSPTNIERFQINVDESNYLMIKKKLIFERSKLINYIHALHEEGLVKSIYRPRNRKLQKHLDEVCNLKRQIRNSIEKITEIFE